MALAIVADWLVAQPAATPATAPASKAATAYSRPVRTTSVPASSSSMPTASRQQIETLVGLLGDEKYAQRLAAQQEFKQLLVVPGIADVLRGQLEAAQDVEAKAVLEELLAEAETPLLVVWGQMMTRKISSGFSTSADQSAAPMVFVRSDGSFLYDAASPVITGAFADSLMGQYLQGKLAPRQHWELSTLVAARLRGQAPATPAMPAQPVESVQLIIMGRSAGGYRSVTVYWPVTLLSTSKPASRPAEELELMYTVRDLLKACQAKPYEGQWVLRAQILPMPRRQDVDKLLTWQLEPALPLALARQGAVVSDEQLPLVRQALAKQDSYKWNSSMGCKLWLAPHVKEAQDMLLGPRR